MKNALLPLLAAGVISLSAGESAAAAPAQRVIDGVFKMIPDTQILPGGLRNRGSLDEVKGAAAPADTPAEELIDPYRLCQPIGPFRMMAEPGSKIEVFPVSAGLMVLFQDVHHGHWRTFYTARGHRGDLAPSWQGDSIARWEGDALVVETTNFNTRTWLNGAGARHSEALRLVERVRPIADGAYLEYQVTATDPQALKAPFSYVRYYARTDEPIAETVCPIDDY